MERRQFIALVGGAATVWPIQARAQLQAKVSLIGFLGLAPEFSGVEALRAGLRDLGYIEGNNLKRRTQNMPLSTRRSFTRGTPRGLFGRNGLMAAHS
jgi:hypothetical protein